LSHSQGPITRGVVAKEMDRSSAALEQLENSIGCFFRGDWASSITLALAVEGMLPPCPDDIDIIATSKRFFAANGFDASAGIESLNRHRNWLKHPKPEKTIQLTELDTVFAILRALSRVLYCTGRVSEKTDAFQAWLVKSNLKQPNTDITQLNHSPHPPFGHLLPQGEKGKDYTS
jgi:hypothetical protein